MVFRLNNAVIDKFNALKATTLNGHFSNNNVLDDAALERRFSKPAKTPHNVSYEFTTDENLLQQYFDIRETVYRQDLGLKNFSGQKDEFDEHSYIMVVKAGEKVVGGVRLTICGKDKEHQLPLESQGYNLREYFPEVDFDNIQYFENSRMAFLPEFRSGEYVHELCRKINEFYVNTGTYVGFCIAPIIQAKRYKAIFNKLGHRLIIRSDFRLPKTDTYADIQPFMCATDLTPNNLYVPMLEKAAVETPAYEEAASREFEADLELA